MVATQLNGAGSPDEQVAFNEILELIGAFAEDEQKIIQLRMDGYSQ